ncbi:MAG: YfaZ family outer membrane protein [Campylobacterota bacterium]|nr:YfaZ family outer membrane protein [Campylobacterota bacterium]
MNKIIAGLVLISGLLFAGNNAQININNNTLELESDIYLNNLYSMNNSSNYYFTVGYLSTENDEGEIDQTLSTIGFKVLNPYMNNYGLSFGIGMRNVYTDQYDMGFSALPLVIYSKYELNEMVYFNLDLSFAPQVLTYLDGEEYKEGKLLMNYKINSDAYIYVGVRYISTKYTDIEEDIEFDDAAFLGFKINF